MSLIPTDYTILPSQPWRRSELFSLLLIVSIAVATFAPFWSVGIPSQADFLMGLYRITELADAWREGIYFARLGLGLNFGYSAPLFQFYPPLASYLALPLVWLDMGVIGAAKAVFTLAAILGGIGVYLYARRLLGRQTAATLAGALYVLSPYLLTVAFERGAMAESVALALLPWLVWASHSLLSDGGRPFLLTTAAFTGLFILAHNITALFVFPALVLYIVALALIGRRLRSLLPVARAFALGLGLAAFYWLPAILELSATNAERVMLGPGLKATSHLVAVQQIVQWSGMHLYAGDQRFRFSLVQFALGLVAVGSLVVRRHERPYALWLLAIGWGAALALQTYASASLWEYAPLARFIQFPWRLFGVGSFCVVLLIASLFTLPLLSGRGGTVVGLGLIGVTFWLVTTNLHPQRLPFWYEVNDEGINRQDMWERGRAGFPLFTDYGQTALQLQSQELAQSRPNDDPARLPPTTLPQEITVVEENPLRLTLDVAAEQPWALRLHRIFFPGWQAAVDGAPIATRPAGAAGLVSAELPAGRYRVTAEFGNSSVRWLANLLSLASLALWFSLCLPFRRVWMVLLGAGAICLVLFTLVWLLYGPWRVFRTPAAFPATFEEEIRLLAFHLPDQEICTHEPLALRLYWALGKSPDVDYKLFLHLARLDDSGVVAQVDTAPFAGFNPMTRWEAGEIVVDEIALHAENAPPGRYMLLAGLYHPDTVQNLRVIHAPAALSGDRLRLTEVDICDAKAR